MTALLPTYSITKRGPKSIAEKRKTTTSTEVKNSWNAKTYKRFTISLRKDEDADLIEFVEEAKQKDIGVTDIFRRGIETMKNEGL